MMENLYRLVLTGLEHTAPSKDSKPFYVGQVTHGLSIENNDNLVYNSKLAIGSTKY